MALSACDGMNIDPAAQATARTAFDHFRRGEDAALVAMMEPSQRASANTALLKQLRKIMPAGEPSPPKETSWRVNYDTSGRSVTVGQEYDYGPQAVTVTTVLVPGSAKTWLIRGFNVNVSINGAASSDAPAASSTSA